MKHINVFDVLVVYSQAIATSATSKYQHQPFSAESGKLQYNSAYAHFLTECNRAGLSAALSTSDAISGAGTCDSFWTYTGKNWIKHRKQCFSNQIFDKFSPVSQLRIDQREKLFSSSEIQPFNDPYLTTLFFDKLLTYSNLSDYAIPTVELRGSNPNHIKKAISKLQDLTSNSYSSADFGKSIIVKDRFGAGGNNIFQVGRDVVKEICIILKNNPTVSFVIQPFVCFENGFSYKNKTAATDIRLIYHQGKVSQTYFRMAKQDDFRCNEHQGGSLVYVKLLDVPKKVLELSNKVVKELDRETSLFALDYIVGNSGRVYLLEGNIGPGIDWNPSLKVNERKSKELIGKIVSEYVDRLTRPTVDKQLPKTLDILPVADLAIA